jgi:hypothetical protein
MPIDWAATGAMLTGWGTLGSGLAIVGAAFLGRRALQDVRLQKTAEREIEHAERALTAIYKVESSLSSIRSPMSTAQELAEARAELEGMASFAAMPQRERDRYVQANVFYQRIRFYQADYDEALSVMPFVRAYFGQEVEKALRDLTHCRHMVRVYADAYARDHGRDPNHSEKIESIIWETGAPDIVDDPVASKAKEALKVLEDALLPVIRAETRSKSLAAARLRP